MFCGTDLDFLITTDRTSEIHSINLLIPSSHTVISRCYNTGALLNITTEQDRFFQQWHYLLKHCMGR